MQSIRYDIMQSIYKAGFIYYYVTCVSKCVTNAKGTIYSDFINYIKTIISKSTNSIKKNKKQTKEHADDIPLLSSQVDVSSLVFGR